MPEVLITSPWLGQGTQVGVGHSNNIDEQEYDA